MKKYEIVLNHKEVIEAENEEEAYEKIWENLSEQRDLEVFITEHLEIKEVNE